MKLTLLRHGQTEGSLRDLYYGATDLPVLPESLATLRESAGRYPTAPRYYTSGLLRCLPESVQNTESKRLVPIAGSPVDLMMLPEGCAFSARCESCMKLCLTRRPELVEVGKGHYSRCWLAALRNAEQGVKA